MSYTVSFHLRGLRQHNQLIRNWEKVRQGSGTDATSLAPPLIQVHAAKTPKLIKDVAFLFLFGEGLLVWSHIKRPKWGCVWVNFIQPAVSGSRRFCSLSPYSGPRRLPSPRSDSWSPIWTWPPHTSPEQCMRHDICFPADFHQRFILSKNKHKTLAWESPPCEEVRKHWKRWIALPLVFANEFLLQSFHYWIGNRSAWWTIYSKQTCLGWIWIFLSSFQQWLPCYTVSIFLFNAAIRVMPAVSPLPPSSF